MSILISGQSRNIIVRKHIEPQNKIVFLGDSITAGLSGSNKHTRYNYPWWVNKTLNRTTENLGSDGGTISGSLATDLEYKVKNARYKDASTVIIAYGINDYLNNENLDKVAEKLDFSIRYLRNKHHKIHILAVLP